MTEIEKFKIMKLKREGFGYKKIATLLNLPANSVKSHLRRHPCDDAIILTDICEMCGKPVVQTPHRKKKRFCSNSCRSTWWNTHPEKGMKRNLLPYSCELCGRTFQSYAAVRHYCSRTCYATARKKMVNDNG